LFKLKLQLNLHIFLLLTQNCSMLEWCVKLAGSHCMFEHNMNGAEFLLGTEQLGVN